MGIPKDNHKVVKEGSVICLFFNKYCLCFSHVSGTVSNARNTLNWEIDKQESTM